MDVVLVPPGGGEVLAGPMRILEDGSHTGHRASTLTYLPEGW